MVNKYKNLTKILIIFFILYLFYFLLLSNIKRTIYSDEKQFNFSYVYYVAGSGNKKIYEENDYNKVYIFTVNPDLYFDLFIQNFTKQFNKYQYSSLIEDINSNLTEEEIIDPNSDRIYLKINSNDVKFDTGRTISLIINSDKKNFDTFNKEIFKRIKNITDINYVNVLKKYIEEQSMLIKSYENLLYERAKIYIKYLENIDDDDYLRFQNGLYKLWFNLSYDRTKLLSHLKRDKSYDFTITRKDLIFALKNIKLFKNYEILAIDYIQKKNDLVNLIATYNKYSEDLKNNKSFNTNIVSSINIEKYQIKDEKFNLQRYQIIIVSFIFSILSTIILKDLFVNRKKYWKLIKNI